MPATHLGRYRHHYVLGAILLTAWFLLPKLIRMPEPPSGPAVVLTVPQPLTSTPLPEHHPRQVPGTEWVVRAVLRRDRGDWDLARVSLTDGVSEPVAAEPGVSEYGAAVSPRGDAIAYTRLTADGCDVVVRPFPEGEPSPAASCTARLATTVDWSPTGNQLAYTASASSPAIRQRRIHLYDIESAANRPLTVGASATELDHYPRFSPAGSKLAFQRGELLPNMQTTLWVVDVDTGEETRLTSSQASLGGMSWIDEQTLLFTIRDGGSMRGRLIDVATGAVRRIESSAFMHPDYRREDQRLIGVAPRFDRDMAVIDSDRDARLIAQSASDDHSGRLSADERWIAFISQRSGHDELWITSTEGETSRRLTSFSGATVSYPDWSPDGSKILIVVQTESGGRLYVVDVDSASASAIDTGLDDVVAPRWIEGGWVAGCRNETGWGICVSEQGEVRRIADGFLFPHPGRAGNLYVIDDTGALFNVSVADGSVTKILDGMPGNGRFGWEIDEGTLYFLARGDADHTGRLMRVDLGGGEPETLYTGAMPVAETTISVGRASSRLLLTLFQATGDDLVVFENPRFD